MSFLSFRTLARSVATGIMEALQSEDATDIRIVQTETSLTSSASSTLTVAFLVFVERVKTRRDYQRCQDMSKD